MNNILIINLLTGLTILFSLIVFHRITFYIFTPAIDIFDILLFSDSRKSFLHEIKRNPPFIVVYIVAVLIEFLIAAIFVLLHNKLGFITTINDVILICLTPGFITYLFVIIVYSIQNYIDPSLRNYEIPIYTQHIRIIVANTTIITLGGLTSMLLIKIFA